ncbi:MAG: DUF2207 domain-containing protein [Atopobiaceae bacterium]|nr:DUF2207 domain-containing protein [Atopobiaceae bacterium]
MRLKCLLMSLVLLVAGAFALATPALADDKDYTLDQTMIWATVNPDGSLQVVEERAVNLDGNFHGFYWEIPTNDSELGGVILKIQEAGEYTGDGASLVPYEFSADPSETAEGTWTAQETSNGTRVDVHYDKTDEVAHFYVSYTLDGAVARWADTAELYWKFIGSQWDKDSHDVTCYVFFAGAPMGTVVTAGDNLRGWLHNASLIGNIDVPSGTAPSADDAVAGDPGTIVMDLQTVRSGDFAEVRSAFPTDWVPELEQKAESRLDTILAEEGAWADKANERFERAGFWANVKIWALNVILGLDAIAVAVSTLMYRNSHRASFDDKYFRDVPTEDHPAVLSYVYTGSAGVGPDFTASLMRLSDMGVVKLEKTTSLRKRLARSPKEEEDLRLVLDPQKAAALRDPIDKATVDFVFGYVAPMAQNISDGNERPDNTVLMTDFKRVANTHETSYEHHLELWKDSIEWAVNERMLDADSHDNSFKVLLGAAGVSFFALALGAADIFLFSSDSMSAVGKIVPFGIRLAILLVMLIAMMMVLSSQNSQSPEAVEIKAKLKALKNWLRDFTRLQEAVPTDVVLWNRLLVMAVVLGVADKVTEQLKLALPEVANDDRLGGAMVWCSPSVGGSSPASIFSSGFTSASSAASSSGSGGGASGGGGGGAGGGGGGAY